MISYWIDSERPPARTTPPVLPGEADVVVLGGGISGLTTADLRSASPSPGTFDLVTANLTGGLLVEAADRLRDLARPGARLILSGFLRHEEDEVKAAFAGYAVTSRSEEEQWACVSVQRP